ncbi:HypC/HybG/HupF family hydrogenase formation chaperone, partial [Candidatus Woesearchaeota archaeon]|nr:HypC/HybG/HupF family hydrogenase formation chaperone [Candidatus Woesearchaeota archaeon]
AIIDYEAEKREAGTALIPEVKVGDYVLVQAKMIVQVIPEQEAKDALQVIKEAGEQHD